MPPMEDLPDAETSVAPNPSEPTETVEIQELSPEELKALSDASGAAENPEWATAAIVDILGGAVGFLGAGFANNYILQQAAAQLAAGTGTPAQNAQTLLLYSGLLMAVEIAAALVVAYLFRSKSGRVTGFVEGAFVGVALAGIAGFVSQLMIQQGQPQPTFPAFTPGGAPLYPVSKTVGT